MDRRTFLRTSGVVATAGLAGCPLGGGGGGGSQPANTDEPMNTDEPSNGGSSGSADTTVDMVNTSFSPKVLEVEAGTTVEWVNQDALAHDVASAQFNDGATSWDFQSQTVSSGGSLTHTFDSEGVYEYYCTIHRQGVMCGVVIVGGASQAGDLPCSGGGGSGGGFGGDY